MNRRFRETLNDRGIRWLWLLALVLNAATWVTMIRFIPHQSNFTPLHYTIYFGINFTGPWWFGLWLPGIGIATWLAQTGIGLIVDHPVWRRMWAVLTVLINVLALLDALAIILLLRTNGF